MTSNVWNSRFGLPVSTMLAVLVPLGIGLLGAVPAAAKGPANPAVVVSTFVPGPLASPRGLKF